MFDDIPSLVTVLLRWGHIMFGIIWLGHLYFFNLVNVPFQADVPKEMKSVINPKLLLRALWWFRWGAMYTFLFGVSIFLYQYVQQGLLWEGGGIANRAIWIMMGMTIATVMWFNVWFVIWPRQKLILGGVIKGTPHPDAVKMGATALKASRFNTYASGPMLYCMIVPSHFSGWNPAAVVLVAILGVGFWFGMIKRSFKISTADPTAGSSAAPPAAAPPAAAPPAAK